MKKTVTFNPIELYSRYSKKNITKISQETNINYGRIRALSLTDDVESMITAKELKQLAEYFNTSQANLLKHAYVEFD